MTAWKKTVDDVGNTTYTQERPKGTLIVISNTGLAQWKVIVGDETRQGYGRVNESKANACRVYDRLASEGPGLRSSVGPLSLKASNPNPEVQS